MIDIPDGDPKKVAAVFKELNRSLKLMRQHKRRALWQLKAWSVITTQRRIAAVIGISPQYLSDLLVGRRELSGLVVQRIAKMRRAAAQ